MKIRESFHFYALITIVCWSLAYVFTRMALHYFTAYSLGFLRCLVASAALLIVVLAAKIKLPEKSDIVYFMASGAAGFFLYMITFNKGCETVSASTSSVIMATVPVITALFANFLYKERLKAFQWLAIAVSFAGVVILTLLNGAVSINRGIIWLLLGAILLSLYNLMQRKLTRKYPALMASAYNIFAGTVMLLIFAPASAAELRNAPPVSLLYVGILGVFSSAAAYLAWAQAFARAKNTSSVSNYMFLTPFLTTLLGFLIAKEVPDFATVAGGLIILSGLFAFNFGGKFSRRA